LVGTHGDLWGEGFPKRGAFRNSQLRPSANQRQDELLMIQSFSRRKLSGDWYGLCYFVLTMVKYL
jgi:hypothetical protein